MSIRSGNPIGALDKEKPQQAPINDNSNPQQGSGVGGASTMSLSAATGSRTDATNRPGAKLPPTKRDSRKLFVGGLPSDVTDDEFRQFFERFGAVYDSVVMFDRETHRSRGFGFVTFQDPEVAQSLLRMGNEDSEGQKGEPLIGRLVMRGKTCEIKTAEPKESGPPRRHFRGQGHRYGERHQMHSADKNLPVVQGHAVVAEPILPPPGAGHPMYAPDASYPMNNIYYPPAPMAGFMAPMYYPSMPHPHPQHPSHPGMEEMAFMPPMYPAPDGAHPPLGGSVNANAAMEGHPHAHPAYAFFPFMPPGHSAPPPPPSNYPPVMPPLPTGQSGLHPVAPGIPSAKKTNRENGSAQPKEE